MPEIAKTRPTAPRNIGLLIVALCLMAMLGFTWRTWPEPLIDFGRELYVPWQLSEGKVLYRDIAYFNGPLSPYINSLAFRLLGTSLMTLVVVNVAILSGVVLMLHRLVARMSDEFTATVACCAFLMLLAVGQPGPVGNYNFITPYSHEMTHGIALSLAAITCLARFVDSRRKVWTGLCGALIGLVFLTKPEIFIAVSLAVVLGLLVTTRQASAVLLFVACAIAPVAIATILFARDAMGAWRWLLDLRITRLEFYQRVRGTYDLHETARVIAQMTLGYAALFGLPLLVGRFARGNKDRRAWQFVASLGAFAALLLILRDSIAWEEVGRPLIFVALGCVGYLAFTVARKPPHPNPLPEGEGTRLVFSIFSLLLLAQIALHVQFYHYGFALAAPALALVIMLVLCWLPAWINRAGGSGALLRGASLAVIAVTAAMYVMYEWRQVSLKTILVSDGPNAFYARSQGETINRVLAQLEELPRDSTLAVVPEGAMINYLSRRADSTPFIVLMPPELIMFSTDRIAEGFAAHPPDYVLMIPKDVTEYGFQGFDVDYGKPIADWIKANYHALPNSPLLARNVTAAGK